MIPMYDKRRAQAGSSKIDRESVLDLLNTLKSKLEAEEPAQVLPAIPPKRELGESQEEMLLEMVRASLKQYGTIVPPREAFYATAEATCPKCESKGPIVTAFGFKTEKNGDIKPQSWCKSCRNSNSAHYKRASRGKNQK